MEVRGIQGFVITGVELRCCVLYAVLGAEERGFRYVVPQDLVSGQDHDEAVDVVRRYLRMVHHASGSAQTVLRAWSQVRDAEH